VYWGSGWNWTNGHCFAGKLNPSMDAFVDTPRDITPPNYFEGPYMLKRDGTYYLTYSQGKCTDTSYKVRYSTAPTPYGPWTEGPTSPILSTDWKNHIYGPGHHTILHYKDKYYIVYHRIADLKKKDLLREICIDRMEFAADGSIMVVHPSQKGVDKNIF
jgi:beta-xylosidase